LVSRVAYRETIRANAEAEGKYIRQTGGSGNYGHAKIRISPNEPGAGYEFSNDTKGGAIPKEYIKPIDQGIQDAMQRGVLAGYEMVDIKVSLYDGSYHDVDSNEMAFKIAGSMAFKEGTTKGDDDVDATSRPRGLTDCRLLGDIAVSPNSQRADSQGRSGGAVLHPELGVDLLEMLVHRPRTEIKDLSDVTIGLATRDPKQHLRLALGHQELLPEHGLVASEIALDEPQQILIRPDLADIDELKLRR